MSLDNHSQVSVIILWHVLLILAQLDCHNAAQMRARVVPGARHEPEDKRFLWPRHAVGRAEHFLSLQHLLSEFEKNYEEK